MTVDEIRLAYEALGAGDVDPLAALIHPQMEWRGRRSLPHFWRPPPSWHGPQEARAVLSSTIAAHRAAGDHAFHLDRVERRGDRVVVAVSWADASGRRHQWAHVLKLADGKIAGMQDYKSPSRAAAAMRLRAAVG